jgi:O-antigen ligase
MIGDQSYSLMTRLEALSFAGRLISESPLLGTGPANYYYYVPHFPLLGWYIPFAFHNNFIDILVQTGIIGAILFFWFFISLGRNCIQLKTQLPDGFSKAFLIGGFGGLAGTFIAGLLGDWIIPFIYNVGISGFRTSVIGWIFLGCLYSVGKIYQASVSNQ